MKKVLIVEDDIALAKSLKAALEVKDYQIEVADCYNLAIRMFQHMTCSGYSITRWRWN